KPLPEEDDRELDEELDLPLYDDDAGDDDEIAREGEEDDLLTPFHDEKGKASLDDESASDLDTGVDLDPLEESAIAGADEEEIDVGPLDEGITFNDEHLLEERPERALEEPDDPDLEEGYSADDGGAEGTNEAPEDEVDEDALPELDADDEGEEGDEELAEVLLAGASEASIPWAIARWIPLEGAGARVPCVTLSIAGGAVVAAGQVLLIVEDGARTARRPAFGAGACAAAITDGLLLSATARGQLLLSTDGGKDASPLASLREGHGPLELAATNGRVFIRE